MPYELLARLHTVLMNLSLRREEGQGTVEYVGVVVLIGILVAAVAANVNKGNGIANEIAEKIKLALDKATPGAK